MRIVAHGVDMVIIERIDRMLCQHTRRFMDRCFTPSEQAYCNSMKNAAQHYAARFAAKEAVLKALGTGLANGIEWTHVEVVREPDGRPTVRLTGRAADVARHRGIDSFLISLSHTDSHAIASVIGVGD